MRYHALAVFLTCFLTCLLAGCGGSSGNGTFVNNLTPNGPEVQVPAGVSTGSVLLSTTLQPAAQGQQTVTHSSQVVPAEVTHFRTTAVDSDGALVFGPEVVVKAASVTFEGVPTTAVRFRIELLTADEMVLGTFSQPITIRAQELIEVKNPTYTFIALVGETGVTGPTGPQGETGPKISRVSVASDGTQGDFQSLSPSISADGRYIAFQASARNLVSGDTNGKQDVFVHDRQTSSTSRVSVASDGTQGNDHSESASISADGRYIAFHSIARNLVSGDTNGLPDIFVHDRDTSTTSRVSVASDGTQGDGSSLEPSISADGRYVVFHSHSTNLVSGDTNSNPDVFVHDRQTSTTSRVSVASDGTQGNGLSQASSLSADGRYVVFQSVANNLVLSDTNNNADIFVHDRQSLSTILVSVASDGTQGNSFSTTPSISADGRYVSFGSNASNLVSGDTNDLTDVFVHDLQTSATTLVSVASDGTQGRDISQTSSISADGRYVFFNSSATNLVSGDTNGFTDVFVHDRQTSVTTLVSVATDGTQGGGASSGVFVSADGRYVAFHSEATNFVSGDTNDARDIFITRGPLAP